MSRHAIILSAILLGLASALSYAQAPVPFINLPLVPDATAPGGPQFTLTVNGTGFVSNSVVNWNGTPLTTQFVSQGQLTATVPAANIARASTGWVTVVGPPPGGGTSSTAFFSVVETGRPLGFGLFSSPALSLSNAVAVGDFNGDGLLDLVISSGMWSSPSLSVFLGDGKGSFTLASTLPVGDNPMGVAVGDFNRDGILDLAVANEYSNSVSILLGDGSGNFTLASTVAVGGYPSSLAVGDFNGDGNLDLAVAGGPVYILLGDGTGNFTASPTVAGGTGGPVAIAVGDFNNDGSLDLAVADEASGTIDILLGDGAGGFTLGSSPNVGGGSTSIVAGDFNGDGNLDLAATIVYPAGLGCPGDTVAILLGDGKGDFNLTSSAVVGGCPFSVALGDLNGDGKLDLAVANADGTLNQVSILLGDGAGNFTLSTSPVTNNEYDTASSVVLGDFNGDGRPDLAVAGLTPPYVLLQGAPGALASPSLLNFGTQALSEPSAPQPVTLTNTGGHTLDITSITVSPNFKQQNKCGSKLAIGASCTISVTFVPHQVGGVSGTVSITDNASSSTQAVSLTGAGTVVDVQPSGLNFGNEPVGIASPPQTVTLTNVGTKTVTIHGIYIAGVGTVFTQTNDCGTTVPAGGTCTISVTFTPNEHRGYTATLEVNDNGGASPQTVSLSGTGTY